MSDGFAIAGVTAVLRHLLTSGMNDLIGPLGTSVAVSALPPDQVAPLGGSETTQLNIFLHQVTPNPGWRNEGLPSRDGSGHARLSNPPLALNLHYLLSAYGTSELFPEILLGRAMQILHDTPVLTRSTIAAALPAPSATSTPLADALASCGLADQIEQIKITPEYLGTEEMSKLWTAVQSHYRPTAAYMATVVLIEVEKPTRSPLPVLSRGGPIDRVSGRDPGVQVAPSLQPPLPTLEAVVPPGGQPVARLGEAIDLRGHDLNGDVRRVVLRNDRFGLERSIDATSTGSPLQIQFSIPVAEADAFPVGVYQVSVQLASPGAPERETNRLAMVLAPEITELPTRVNRTTPFTVNFRPAVRPGQRAALLLGQQEFLPQAFTPPTTSLSFLIDEAPEAPEPGLLARLRIDGIENPIIDRTPGRPPVFLGPRIIIT